jgi:hypothetical protein
MTILTNTFTRYDAVGVREEIEDVIYNISPEETPFISNAGRDDCTNTLIEWQTDSLAAAAANAKVEGDDVVSVGFTATVATLRAGNYTQISTKSVSVSGTEEIVNKAGRKSELSYQLAKHSAELKRDVEYNILALNTAGAVGTTTTARKAASLLTFLYTNIGSIAGGGANPSFAGTGVPAGTRGDGTTPVAFTETNLKSVAQQCWTSGGNPKTIMVDGPQKQTISSFGGIATKTYMQTEEVTTAIIGAADVYVGDFGVYAIVPNRFQRHRDAWFLDWEYLKVVYLRKFQQIPLAKTGDAENRMLLVEWSLKVTNQAASGLAPDLS